MKLRGSGTFMQALKRTHQIAKEYDETMSGYLVLLIIYAGVTFCYP